MPQQFAAFYQVQDLDHLRSSYGLCPFIGPDHVFLGAAAASYPKSYYAHTSSADGDQQLLDATAIAQLANSTSTSQVVLLEATLVFAAHEHFDCQYLSKA